MISVTSMQLEAWIAAFIFPLARILALVASAPVIGNRQVPARVKIGLGLLITFLIAPTLNIPPDIEPSSGAGLFIMLQQILLGLAMGFSMRLIFTAVEMAGDIMGMQMGLGFASFYDPVNATNTQIVAQFLGIIAVLLFLSLNGHLYMLDKMYTEAYLPYSEKKISLEQAYDTGIKPLRTFMLRQTRETDLALFVKISNTEALQSADDVPLKILVPSYVISELKTAFQIGFVVFIPFLIIDMVVASVLMSMGMMMVSPAMISLPFKIMLFVLADGWNLLVGSLVQSFYT